MNSWTIEEIPDEDALYYRVPLGWLPSNKQVFTGVFRESGGSMSTDWSRYSSAAQTRARQGRPERFAVLKMVKGQVAAIAGLTVQHSPVQGRPDEPDNRAHSDVFGLNAPRPPGAELAPKERIRTALLGICNGWEIPPDALVE
jgi:hypothetical protein